ncbi:penicillin-binding transpeptidase domain-containing protein [Haloferula sargassicola]|uniref:beta-lactamase n=1 Tax=Haloferula sargassicola TaxID=490096 RepID=A0ABP9UP46_9BACT
MRFPFPLYRLAAFAVVGLSAHAQNAPAEDPPSAIGSADDASIFNRKDARTIQLEIPAPRGPILDREGFPLAQNRVVYRLAVQYEQFSNEERDSVVAWGREKVEAAKRLFGAVHEPTDDELYQHYRHRRWLPLPISTTIKASEAEELEKKLPRGVELQAIYERYYPEHDLAAHIIGYTGDEGKLPTGPINLNDPLWEKPEGRTGFEKIYDKELTGTSATLRMVFNEKGEMLLREQRGKPRTGGAVVSTLNLRWQKRAEDVLDDHAKRGAFVVIDVVTGEVLVMASNPSFDLNDWIPGISQKEFVELQEDPDKPLYARAFQGGYPPASSFKPIIALAALNNGTINRGTTFHCPAYLTYGNHKLWNWSHSAYGDLSVVSALKWSNNPWFAQVGNKVGSGQFLALARRLGYGSESGLPLTGEFGGFIPTPEWVREKYHRPITDGDAANWSIGQGAVLATPLQVAQGMAGIANGGVLPKLHLVMQVQDGYGRVLKSAQPEKRNWLGLDEKAVDIVKEGMREVVDSGTGRAGGLGWIEICGKTGTGQWGPQSKRQGVAWFAGFMPAEQPRLAFACLYEGRPGQSVSGGRNAAPMVPAFFDHFRDEIDEMCKPAPKAVAVVDEVEEQEKSEGVLRALPVSPLEDELIEGDDEQVPSALPVDEEQLDTGDEPFDPAVNAVEPMDPGSGQP